MVTAENRIASLDSRLAKVEGILEQMSLRLDRVESDLRNKADKWELRLWFIFITTILGVILARLFVL